MEKDENDKYSVIYCADSGRLCVKYYHNNLLHRKNGPAVYWYAGFSRNSDEIAYYENGMLHRDNNLPARINDQGICKWYIHGVEQQIPKFSHKNLHQLQKEVEQIETIVNNEINKYDDWGVYINGKFVRQRNQYDKEIFRDNIISIYAGEYF